jgi:hypothetical protein
MVGKPRITVAVVKDAEGVGELRLYLNPEGRDLLVDELKQLNEKSDHLHLQAEEWTIELPLQTAVYVPHEEELVDNVKVLLRLDPWDEEYFPHVMRLAER